MIAKGGWQPSATDLDHVDLSLAPPNRVLPLRHTRSRNTMLAIKAEAACRALGACKPSAAIFVAVRSRHMARGEATKVHPYRFRTAIRGSCFSASRVVSRPPSRRPLRTLICRGLPLSFLRRG